MRLPLSTLEIFVAIARHGSFRAAAQSLDLKPSTVSHQLRTLERQLDTALFVRTTRSVSLTEAGRALLRGAGPAFDQLSDALESARTTGHAARGTLRLALPDFVYDLLVGPAVETFCAKYPEIEVELAVSDAFTDLLGEKLHAGFRLGDRIMQDMVAVRLTQPLPLAVLASPAYLETVGAPSTPDGLLQHNCIRYRFQTSSRLAQWEFSGSQGNYTVEVTGSQVVNTLPAAIDLAVRGLGLTYTFRDFARKELATGALVTVLDTHVISVPGVFIYFPQEYRSMVPLRLFLDHLKALT